MIPLRSTFKELSSIPQADKYKYLKLGQSALHNASIPLFLIGFLQSCSRLRYFQLHLERHITPFHVILFLLNLAILMNFHEAF
jgi:hypothetical protein